MSPLGILVLVLVVLFLLGGLGGHYISSGIAYGYGWGNGGIGLLGIVLIIVVVLLFTGRL
jgi:hypothetical protein